MDYSAVQRHLLDDGVGRGHCHSRMTTSAPHHHRATTPHHSTSSAPPMTGGKESVTNLDDDADDVTALISRRIFVTRYDDDRPTLSY